MIILKKYIDYISQFFEWRKCAHEVFIILVTASVLLAIKLSCE